MSEHQVTIHTDGACSGNPGPGGFGAILQWGDHTRELKGGEAHTTNNRMELMAAITALESLKRTCVVDLHTDSQYLRNGIMTWIKGWRRMSICGSGSMPRSPTTRCVGTGCAAIPATISTSAPTSLLARQSRS